MKDYLYLFIILGETPNRGGRGGVNIINNQRRMTYVSRTEPQYDEDKSVFSFEDHDLPYFFSFYGNSREVHSACFFLSESRFDPQVGTPRSIHNLHIVHYKESRNPNLMIPTWWVIMWTPTIKYYGKCVSQFIIYIYIKYWLLDTSWYLKNMLSHIWTFCINTQTNHF